METVGICVLELLFREEEMFVIYVGIDKYVTMCLEKKKKKS